MEKKKKKKPFYSLHHLKYKCVKVQVSKNKNELHIHKYLDRIKFKFCIKKIIPITKLNKKHNIKKKKKKTSKITQFRKLYGILFFFFF